jgi:hypothetical protein
MNLNSPPSNPMYEKLIPSIPTGKLDPNLSAYLFTHPNFSSENLKYSE